MERERRSRQMKTLTINVEGWPKAFVEMVERFAEQLGHQVRDKPPAQPPPEWPRWPGIAVPPEALRREEIYKDVR